MLRHYGLKWPTNSPTHVPLITIIDRKGTRKIWDFEQLLKRVKSHFPEANITAVDFAQLTLRDQVRLATETDVLVGIHGAGLTHSLWLNPKAAVVEFKPPLFPGGLGYVAQLNGASYYEGRTLWPEVWNLTVNKVPFPAGWLAPESDPAWQSREYVYVDPDDLVELIDAALRSQAHTVWDPPLEATCVSNTCHYDRQGERKGMENLI
jgi:EGF domain-specific O-GlcNAc transferase